MFQSKFLRRLFVDIRRLYYFSLYKWRSLEQPGNDKVNLEIHRMLSLGSFGNDKISMFNTGQYYCNQ